MTAVRFICRYPEPSRLEAGNLLHPGLVAKLARVAEDTGWDGFAFTEHPAPGLRWLQSGGHQALDPFAALGYVAAVTSRLRLLTYLSVLPYRNPMLLAKAAATVDILSSGRFILGVGTGYSKAEFHAVGVEFDERNALRSRAARYGAGWIGVLTDDRLAGAMRTATLPDHAAVRRATTDLRERARGAGRDPGEIAVGLAGLWPMLDVRRGWDAAAMTEAARTMARDGVGTLFVTVCGDDVSAANDTVAAFAEQVIAVVNAKDIEERK